jgi:hypothetical protein
MVMTGLLILVHSAGALALFAGHRLPDPVGRRFVRSVSVIGVAAGLIVFFARDALDPWRGIALTPEVAAPAGLAIACAWGLVLSLDLETDRWWAGGLVGVASTSLLFVAGSGWTAVVLLFVVCSAAVNAAGGLRSRSVAWLSFAAADSALAAGLVFESLAQDSWNVPTDLDPRLTVPVLLSAALRAGLFPRIGSLATLHTPAAALVPIAVGVGAVTLTRWGPAEPMVAGAVLLVALAVVAQSVFRRVLDPSILGAWAVAVPFAVTVTAERAAGPAACAAVLAATVIALWPDAVERGRLSRSVALSGSMPTIASGAIAIAARVAFDRAGLEEDPVTIGAWLAVSALLPIALAAGVALAVFVARSEESGGYHPEAVFMTWVVLVGSVVTGLVLGSEAVFSDVGSEPAVALFGVALGVGAFVAARTEPRRAPAASARVYLGSPPALGRWAQIAAALVHLACLGLVAWFTYRGLEVGFL